MLVILPHFRSFAPEKRGYATSPERCGPTLVLIGLDRHELFGLDEVDDAGIREMAEQAVGKLG